MAIKLNFKKTEGELVGRSKIWGGPDLPDTIDYPVMEIEADGKKYLNPLSFICQIHCEDIAHLDKEGLLPHEGMLYFFAEIDYFLGDMDFDSPAMGEWEPDSWRVLYSPVCEDLHTHTLVDSEGAPLGLPAEEITFSECGDKDYGFKMLGRPYFDEIEEQYPGWTSLLQLDCEDDWGLRFYDCGMLCFLKKKDEIKCYLHSS